MKKCHVCGFDCENEAQFCIVCGAELKSFAEYEQELELERKQQEVEDLKVKNPVLAAAVEDVVMAEIYKDVLRDNQIPFTCDENDDAMQIVFGGGFTSQKIYVEAENLELAQQLYDEIANADTFFEDDFEDFNEQE